ncbi:MAG: xanthine dehydrogenase accessory protein XdhC [Planktotalea sp.]|uniref:xanthine dehydrogenase accessory protein XdhC n=1 Tax=Planktotalea sp. TaxID=2029877 RepID=UPI003C733C53
MGFDLNALRQAIRKHGRVARVVIADVKGSSPREIGASMLVWQGGQSGTIGGGTLEFELAKRALDVKRTLLSKHALGPELGQCCGGAVQVLTEVFCEATLPDADADLIARACDCSSAQPFLVQKLLAQARSKGSMIKPQLCDGWFIEPIAKPSRELWIWGAGHVGRAMVQTLAPLPDIAITWIDTSEGRFPDDQQDNVTKVPCAEPAALLKHAPANAEHLILTYSHALDLELCHQALGHDFAFAGLIGSKSKWGRFRARLRAFGHTDAQISRITCPIGDPNLGKHPQAIAIGVASCLLAREKAPAQNERIIA